VSYCSATGTPFGQTPPTGYESAASNPAGCDFNGCDIGGVTTSCQQNFCMNANGNCSSCQ
jgi:hypothetical protein